MPLVKITDIKIGNRFRKDLGDIDSLAESIKELGLIEPIVISENNELICGERRIPAAIEKIESSEVPVVIADPKTELRRPDAEATENTVRKNFTIEEISMIDESIGREKRMKQESGKLKVSLRLI